MRVNLLLSGVLLSTVVGVYGSSWVELPCISKDFSEVRLLANSSAVQVWNGRTKLVEETLCPPEKNLSERLLVETRNGTYTINLGENNKYEWGFVERVTPLKGSSGRVAGQTAKLIIVGVTFKVVDSCCKIAEGWGERSSINGTVNVQLPFMQQAAEFKVEIKPGLEK